ncbi:MAG: crotonase/enoyl-CoA hydratase family protein [Proteobacteria bacterium]|nr:crotonase/enoyl-CoA hydratase family protein [Pseudomonadota bacterium]MCP4922144.1 crotonase/enoyl-CoA hydratase family protein [Pseudomonadota bacterium]
MSHLTFDVANHVAIVTMNRPQARNAWSLEMLARMADAWEEIDRNPDIRVAVLTGAGGNFCAGADLKLMHSDQSDNPWHKRFRDEPTLHWRSMLRSRRLDKPLICAVEGFALGGGTEILQATDIRVAAKGATFGLTECALGVFPLGGSTVRLQRQIPRTLALEMLLTGRHVSAAEALSWGLIGRVVEDGAALDAAKELATTIAGNGPLAVQAIKRSVYDGADLSEEDALALELKLGGPIFETKDAREGPRAFAERRKPVFSGE